MPERSARAWEALVDALDAGHIEWRVSGGLAARWYGSRRPLADIDIDVRAPDLPMAIRALVRAGAVITVPETLYRDAEWETPLATLSLDGQGIDLTGADQARIRDHRTGEWSAYDAAGLLSEGAQLGGRSVRVISRAQLLEYKTRLGRAVDTMDVTALSGDDDDRSGDAGAGHVLPFGG